MQRNLYVTHGVSTTPVTPVFGKKVTLSYNGLLPQSGAKEVFARIGFGHHWKDISDYKMIPTDTGFETTIPVSSADDLNVCFRDPVFNWDNNGGHNYTFNVME
jgi:hypothetical protein